MKNAAPINVAETSTADTGNEQTDDSNSNHRIFTSHMFRNRNGSNVVFRQEPPTPPPTLETVRRPARVARMLALAHHLERAVDSGEYLDRAELSRRYGITRARVTQILNLTLLAPDIQDQILHLEAVDGLEPSSERALREVSSAIDWEEQRLRWNGFHLSLMSN
jgi:hypothetical protein